MIAPRAIAVWTLLAMNAPALVQPGPQTVLDRSPVVWSAAEPGRWKDWDADVRPPEVVQPYLLRSIAAYRRGDRPAALAALFELLGVAPEYPSALHQAGILYFQLRRHGDAIIALERYLAVAPHRVGDTRTLAHAYYSLGRYEKARAHYIKVLDVHPKSAEARHGYGLCLMRLGEPAAALKELRRTLELDPNHARAATWIAQILFDEERVEDALTAAEHARDLDPFAPRAWFLLSQILFELERDDAAETAKVRFDELSRMDASIRAIESSLVFDPDQPELFRRLCLLHLKAGNRRALRKALSRWERVDPTGARAFLLREK